MVVTAAKDTALRSLREADRWEAVVRGLPLVAHWLDGTPIDDGVQVMAKIEDRYRGFVVDGKPVATGVVAVADSWACTNPANGRGVSIGMLHARDAPGPVARRRPRRPGGVRRGRSMPLPPKPSSRGTARTLTSDRHRLGEIEAGIRGEAYDSPDPAYQLEKALDARAPGRIRSACGRVCDIRFVLRTPEEVFAAARAARQDPPARIRLARRAAVRSHPRGAPLAGFGAVSYSRTEARWDGSTSSGVGIEYEVTGQGRPVVLLHGFPDTGRLWRNQVPALAAAGFQVIVPDLRGYGALRQARRPSRPTRSRSWPGTSSPSSTDLGLDRAHVVGHDWGAALAWGLAVARARPRRPPGRAVGRSPDHVPPHVPQQREKSWYMLLFQFPGIAEQWLTDDDWANFRAWAAAPRHRRR